jgi:hypothetical protein
MQSSLAFQYSILALPHSLLIRSVVTDCGEKPRGYLAIEAEEKSKSIAGNA